MNIITPEDVEMLPCASCKKDFSPDCAETFTDRFHNKGYKCPHCKTINY